MNPFEGQRTQQYRAAVRGDGAVQMAAPTTEPPAAAAWKAEPPAASTLPAPVEQAALEEPAQQLGAPVPPKEGPESLRQVVHHQNNAMLGW